MDQIKKDRTVTAGTSVIGWNYDGIGEAPDGSHYVIDSFKVRGEPRWWTVRHVPAGELVGHDYRTFRMFPHTDTHDAPSGIVISETSHSERRAQEMAERHLKSR